VPLRSRARGVALALLVFLAHGYGAARPAGVLLVEKPSLADPDFARTVIAVAFAQAPDGAAIGVIVNHPLSRSLAELVPDQPRLARFTAPLHAGEPVERNGLFALYVAPAPVGESLTVGAGMHLALLPADVEPFLDAPPAAQARLGRSAERRSADPRSQGSGAVSPGVSDGP
jgi:hypothetical protein